ncbi:Mor transcription activator family protein [Eikenella sp. HMSC061C02]|uniref:Mor transcription activator family protein n=1 Tax=Eikenella sp. HMSC061C02 TaxID=1715021 RepID=UPI0008A1B08B|nr:Mor transcription activator family protein [Eikenella sp. HMSC061C02]OFN60611.1 DNA-binding protein [Eikenella sp. HMSC061C02]
MTQARVAELLSDLAAKVGEEVQSAGVADKKQAKNIGNHVAKRMAREWGGQLFYIPHGVLWDIDERDVEIFEKFNGSNQNELAKEYGFSVQWVYRIIERVRQAKIDAAQQDLFDEGKGKGSKTD